MGIVNATPDSFSDAGELPDARRARRARARAGRGGRATCSTSAASRRSAAARRCPPTRRPRASCRVIERIARELDVLVSVDTYKPAVARGRDRGRRAARQRRLRAARPGAGRRLRARRAPALVLMHTRAAPKGTLLDPGLYDDVVADVRDFLARADRARARRRGARPSSSCSIPGPDFAKTPAQTVRGAARGSTLLHALGRPLLLAVSRKDFVGAITGRAAARARRRRRWPRSAAAATPARTSSGCTTSPRPPTSSPCARCCAASASWRPAEGLTPDRYPRSALA